MSKHHGTAIEWTHIPGYKGETWNPLVGCSILSSGCKNCYAMRTANRFQSLIPQYIDTVKIVNGNPVWTGKVNLADEKKLTQPMRWKKPRSIFVNSMSDLFHEDVPDEWIDKIFAVMALCPQHIFIVLTKRAGRMYRYYNSQPYDRWNELAGTLMSWDDMPQNTNPLKNVWLGVSCEDQKTAEQRIPSLLSTPAAVRVVSLEPLLSPIKLNRLSILNIFKIVRDVDDDSWPDNYYDALLGKSDIHPIHNAEPPWSKLDWVIAGGESGPNARPCAPDWIRQIRDDCKKANTPFFFKQWGEWLPWESAAQPPFQQSQNGQYEDGHFLFHDYEENPNWDDGLWYIAETGSAFDAPTFQKVGKKAAGHLLDGEVHQAFPEILKEAV